MITQTAVLAEALTALPDADPEIRQNIGAELLYALGVMDRPCHDDEESPL